MSEFWAALAAGGYGFGSALIPVLNAEAYMGAAGALAGPVMLVVITAAMTVGTVCGKVLIFHGARAGQEFAKAKAMLAPREADRQVGGIRRTWRAASDTMLGWLSHPWRGAATVFAAASLGIPPLLAVSALAGLSKQSLWIFVPAVALGRAIRFSVIAFTIAGLL
jgi:membrane protein YqaA with SNARE-associated domain